ncbi:hypothetical protein AB0Y20_11785 [Heyndrickxia oleronia]|jgi:hypothetical protein|uniref:hypothetical protein n=1 Tax=Heyndrickxia oleronia TaxID=38875 RepID=UPI003F26BDBB
MSSYYEEYIHFGYKRAQKEIATRLIFNNYNLAFIADITKLPLYEVNVLKQQIDGNGIRDGKFSRGIVEIRKPNRVHFPSPRISPYVERVHRNNQKILRKFGTI